MRRQRNPPHDVPSPRLRPQSLTPSPLRPAAPRFFVNHFMLHPTPPLPLTYLSYPSATDPIPCAPVCVSPGVLFTENASTSKGVLSAHPFFLPPTRSQRRTLSQTTLHYPHLAPSPLQHDPFSIASTPLVLRVVRKHFMGSTNAGEHYQPWKTP